MNTISKVLAGLCLMCIGMLGPAFGQQDQQVGNDRDRGIEPRYIFVTSTDMKFESAQAVLLFDMLRGEVVILASHRPQEALTEILRHQWDVGILRLSVMPIDDKDGALIVLDDTSEPIGNETTSVDVYDPRSEKWIFSEFSRSQPLIEDINGDGRSELVLFLDPWDFDELTTPFIFFWPVVYAYDNGKMVRQAFERDAAYGAFTDRLIKEIREFIAGREADCADQGQTAASCAELISADLDKARDQFKELHYIQSLMRALGQ